MKFFYNGLYFEYPKNWAIKADGKEIELLEFSPFRDAGNPEVIMGMAFAKKSLGKRTFEEFIKEASKKLERPNTVKAKLKSGNATLKLPKYKVSNVKVFKKGDLKIVKLPFSSPETILLNDRWQAIKAKHFAFFALRNKKIVLFITASSFTPKHYAKYERIFTKIVKSIKITR